MNTLLPILHKLVEYLGYKDVVKSGLKEVWDTFNEWLQEKYGGWKKILKKAFDVSIEAALSALKAVKEEIIKVCKENHKILEQLTKFATKACLGPLVMKQALKAGAKISAREGTKHRQQKWLQGKVPRVLSREVLNQLARRFSKKELGKQLNEVLKWS